MSGIAGIADFYGEQPASDCLQVMLDTMSYRGPDGRSFQVEHGVVFGHLALDSTGKSGRQPATRSGSMLVADVHLTQREVLCADLSCATDLSDSELLLAAYQSWGKECVNHLTGSFAFAVFDGDSLFMARDPIGVKPLYYADSPDRRLFFASEAKPVARATGAALSATRFADALVFPLEHVDKVSTPWQGVYRLPPGTMLVADKHGLSLTQYWDGSQITPLEMDDEAWVVRFRETLQAVLRDHQAPGEVMGMTLSGGVDSGTLVCMAAAAGMPVRCFSTVREEDSTCKETRHIQVALSECHLDAHLINPADIDVDADLLLDQLSSLQEPFDAHMLQLMVLNLAARRAGHRSLIDGVDGEMIYSMPSNYPSLLYREGRYLAGLCEAWKSSRLTGTNPFVAVYGSLRGLGAPEFARSIKRHVTQAFGLSKFSQIVEDSWINEGLAADQGTVGRLRDMHHRIYRAPGSMFEAHRQSVTHPAIAAALERYDRVAALSGIESRHPLLDLRLVELMLSAPDHLKVRDGWSKYLLRRSGAPDVPDEISWRTDKEENSLCFSERLAELKGHEIHEYLEEHRQSLEAFVKSEALGINDGTLVDLFAVCHWLLNNRREFDVAG